MSNMETLTISEDLHLVIENGRIMLQVGAGQGRWLHMAEVKDVDEARRKLETAGLIAEEQTQSARQYAGRCQVHLIHEDKSESRCVLPKAHLLDDSDHEDEHGHHAPVLVHQSTIREVKAISDARDAGLIE